MPATKTAMRFGLLVGVVLIVDFAAFHPDRGVQRSLAGSVVAENHMAVGSPISCRSAA